MTVTTERAAGRSLITPVLFDRLTQRITTDHPDITQADAERILDQALAFLATCATSTIPLGPSDIVDIGWHTFLLYTGEYADFCTKVAGRYIHHAPDDLPGAQEQGASPAATVSAIRAAGYRIESDLWPSTAEDRSDCSQCHAGCHDSPKAGK
ncbi:hypothetical protein GCM10010193_39630 [Kitasatospora atroaurantiaca]|uniref:Uncharacterized protein n=1 Tax=Kitasatospora atroaurantiaca TaxID=285545 RepID=A0A561EMP3_9ACTN|nr:hypothetical protein [Kitasatospora atroaurantiaca]TWE16877.1 hypothetical protein FB465_1870 [Kitasatospora atroaurantiaca]